MRPRNRKVLWLALFVLVIVLTLMLTAFGQMKELNGDTQAVRPDPFGLGFEDTCWDCHETGLRNTGFDTSFYCHGLPLAEGYYSRLYLERHLAWIRDTMNMPPELYLPPATATETDAYVHIFGLSLLPSIVTIPVGTTVTWVNMDIDTSTLIKAPQSNFSPFLRINLDPGASFSYTFTRPGVFNYAYKLKSSQIAQDRSLYDSGGRIIVGDDAADAYTPGTPLWWGNLIYDPLIEVSPTSGLTPDEINALYALPPEFAGINDCELEAANMVNIVQERLEALEKEKAMQK